MSDSIITVENLSKRYRIGERDPGYKTFREAIIDVLAGPVRNLKRLRKLTRFDYTETSRSNLNPVSQVGKADQNDVIWALKNVSFEIRQGEIVGIIGRNGAGKSTLLKILSRITDPTTGDVKIYGRISSLLEVGTGFHKELTGRENIFLSGAILGMRKQEIKRKFDEIVAFAETEKFIDTPVKHYSSGMYLRLAFAVAAHLEPEILLVDEVLAVGDAAFQKKCLGKMKDVSKGGRTVLFVSHNMGAIRSLCSKTILLNKGRTQAIGSTEDIIRTYVSSNSIQYGCWKRPDHIPSSVGIFFEEISIRDEKHEIAGHVDSTKPFSIIISVYANADIWDTQIACRVTNEEGIHVFTTANNDIPRHYLKISRGRHTYRIELPGTFLKPGQYTLQVASMIPSVKLFDIVDDEVTFSVEDAGSHANLPREKRLGVVTPLLVWEER